MRLHQLVLHLARYLNPLLREVDHPESGWNEPRRRFLFGLLVGLITAGNTLLSEIVRHMPGTGAIRHRYKAFDRMLGHIDLVPLAAAQTARLADGVGEGWIIGLDTSDIRKFYAKKMEALADIHDGSTGEIGKGYSLVTACAFDLDTGTKAQPRPLLFEVFSSAEEDFKSENTVWLDAIDRLHAAAPRATIAIDRAADNGKVLRRLLDHRQPFVVRLQTHDHSRHLLFGADSRARVRDAWKEATSHGEITAVRLADDGKRTPYTAEYASMKVRLPGRNDPLWLCVFDCPDHEEPMVLLTNRQADTAEQTANVLVRYLARWVAEDQHRWAKQEFGLEDVRTLTYRRLKNMVAAVWLAMGFTASVGGGPDAREVLTALEAKAQQLRKAHADGQFWGYALVRGMRALLADGARVLPLFPWLGPAASTRQQLLPGFRA
jgi:hypothetical protein